MKSQRVTFPASVARAGLALAVALAARSNPAWAITPAEQSVSDVRMDIEHGDCKSAVSALNKGLAAHYPEVQMLAGSLYENGVCLKANWDRAVNFYSTAYKNGQRQASLRLAAGFAAPENGPDVASALWWASRARIGGSGCAPEGPAHDDPDRFLAEVKTWSDERVAACNYIAGVMSTIVAEVRYPTKASSWATGGDVLITFKPATSSVALTLDGTQQYLLTGSYNGDRLWERNDKQIGSAFVQAVRDVADRALKRYPKPDKLPADIPDVKATMHFVMEDARMPHYY